VLKRRRNTGSGTAGDTVPMQITPDIEVPVANKVKGGKGDICTEITLVNITSQLIHSILLTGSNYLSFAEPLQGAMILKFLFMWVLLWLHFLLRICGFWLLS
jgi:hypothetical protein